MNKFKYKAKNQDGKDENGIMEGSSISAIANDLLNRGLKPYSIVPVKSSESVSGEPEEVESIPVESVDLELFCQQMNSLLSSGVPILRALDAISESAASPAMGISARKLREDLDDGYELSVCLARQSIVYDSFFVSMIRAGESTGRIDEVFEHLRHHLEFQRTIKEQTKSATRYPMIVAGAMLVALGIVNWFVIPSFASAYKGFGAELPFFTKLLISISDFFVAHGVLILISLIGSIYLFLRWIKLPTGRLVWDKLLLSMPIAGPLIRKASIARFSRALALSFQSGVPINQALSLVAPTASNVYITSRLEELRPAIERGESLYRACVSTEVFTKVALQMILLGEESGRLDVLMQRVSELYQKDVERDLKLMAAQIEPFLIVGIGAMVLVLALGIFLPIWNLGSVALK